MKHVYVETLLKIALMSVAWLAMFATLPASAASGLDSRRKARTASPPPVEAKASPATSSQEDRPARARLDEYYPDLKLPWHKEVSN